MTAKTKTELEIEIELLKARLEDRDQSRTMYLLEEKLAHLTEQHRLLNICACEEERKAKNWKYAYEELSTATEALRTENRVLTSNLQNTVSAYDELNERCCNLQDKHRELTALQATMQDINNGLRADLGRTQQESTHRGNELIASACLIALLRGDLTRANERYDALDFSVNESVKKSSIYQTLAHEHEIMKIVLRDLGFKIIPTPP